jgi:hypothetical protein
VDADVVREAKLEVWQLGQTVGHNKIVVMMKKAPDIAVLTSRPGVKHMIRCCLAGDLIILLKTRTCLRLAKRSMQLMDAPCRKIM